MTEAYFRAHGSVDLIADLEKMIATASPPSGFSAPQAPPRAHRGKEIANRNAAGFAALSHVPRG